MGRLVRAGGERGGVVSQVVGAVAAVVLLAVAGIGALTWSTLAFASDHDGRILPGARIAGVNVGGMEPDAAIAAVRQRVEPGLDRRVTVRFDGRSWSTTPRELGSGSDAEAAVAEAVEASRQAAFTDLLRMRWWGGGLEFDGDVGISHSREAVRAFVEDIAGEVDVEARDAGIDASSGWVQIVPAQGGQRTDVDATVRELLAALEQGATSVALEVDEVEPEVATERFDKVILLRQSDHTVHLYENGTITHSWPVAVGARASGYPTPTGIRFVELKRHMPTWVNPDPKGWGRGMPARIGPGSNNPLGVRALNWSGGDAIRFHGTANVNSIGTDASKGCVRLTNDDIVELFDLVEVGTPIVSVR